MEGGNKIAEKMAEELQRVINGIDGIVKAVEEAAENSSEQNRSMQKINETIGIPCLLRPPLPLQWMHSAKAS